MATKHEFEIEITSTGEVQVTVKGAKGKKCLDYVKLFSNMGEITGQHLTSEYYEPEVEVGITDQTSTRLGS